MFAYSDSFAERCFEHMFLAEELDGKYETLNASLSELNKTVFCSEKFMANYVTSAYIIKENSQWSHGNNHVFYVDFACKD